MSIGTVALAGIALLLAAIYLALKQIADSVSTGAIRIADLRDAVARLEPHLQTAATALEQTSNQLSNLNDKLELLDLRLSLIDMPDLHNVDMLLSDIKAEVENIASDVDSIDANVTNLQSDAGRGTQR